MPLALPTAIAVYITCWWVTLFAVLPFGVTSRQEAHDEEVPGSETGAPVAPRLLLKAVITTLVSAIVFALLMAVLRLTE